MRVLLDLRPALAGRAGIPQECRLLYWGLSTCPELEVTGLLQSGHLALPNGDGAEVTAAEIERALRAPRRHRWLHLLHMLPVVTRACGAGSHGARLPCIAGELAASHWWPLLFASTLDPVVARGDLRLVGVPWSWMAAHAFGLTARALGGSWYPHLDTSAFDVVVAQTPYPGRVSPNSTLVVRYHDAVPMLMTATTRSGRFDAAAHAAALAANVRDGAWFACVSEAARSQLVRVCPQASARSVVIPNMLAPTYRPSAADPARARSVILSRAADRLTAPAVVVRADSLRHAPFVLAVSTIEPRKNHLRLIEAWEQVRREGHPELELVLVGSPGWQTEAVFDRLRPWIAQGQAHHLQDLEAEELRLLYSTAAVTVCPALDEGFGYTALESLACGGVVAASDIPAHREVCRDVAVYFDPEHAAEIADGLKKTLCLRPELRSYRREVAGPARAADFEVAALAIRWRDWLATVRDAEARRSRGRA